MGKLAELAGTSVLTGQVTFTDAGGFTRSFEGEDEALKAIGSKEVFHHRGAFWEKGCTPRGYTPPEEPKAKPSSSGRRRKPKPEADSSE